jgi:hypothetical protein
MVLTISSFNEYKYAYQFVWAIVFLNLLEYTTYWIEIGNWIIKNVFEPVGEGLVNMVRSIGRVLAHWLVAPYEDREYNHKRIIRELQNQLRKDGKLTDVQFRELRSLIPLDDEDIEDEVLAALRSFSDEQVRQILKYADSAITVKPVKERTPKFKDTGEMLDYLENKPVKYENLYD